MALVKAIRLPRGAIPVLQRLADLTDDRADALIAALSEEPIRDMAGLVATARRAINGDWAEDDVEALVSNLMALSALGTSHDFTASELADAVAERMAPNLTEESQKEGLHHRLDSLLTASSFDGLSKALDVFREYDRALHLSRVVTDIRPVFTADPTADPMGALIIHTLRLDYFQDGRVQSLSFAVTPNDLAHLRKIVDRAEKKAKTLSRTLGRSGLTEYDVAGTNND